ncbi:MAG: UDP-glucose 4-epimerase [Acidobacteria bacterium]|nr:MAG: UDP-glucose 4-epimerase [Acidobacteriota bacterium]
MKRILVTGGAGYIGSVLSKKLVEAGYDIVVLDALIYTGVGVDALQNHPRFRLIPGDIRDLDLLKTALTGVDCVVHLAALANDPSAELNPALTRQVNLEIYPALLNAAAATGVKRFLNMSSISVYGVSHNENLTEDDPVNPLTEYAVCKARSEAIVRASNRDDFTTVSLRCGTVCGWSPRMRFDLCTNTLTAYAIVNRKLAVWGGMQKRPQIHIGDVTNYLLALIEIDKEVGGKIFNAAGHNTSVREVAETIRAVMKGAVELEDGPAREDERSYTVSSEKISRELGLTPEFSIKDAVAGIVDAHQRGLWCNPDDVLYHNVKRMAAMEKAAAC